MRSRTPIRFLARAARRTPDLLPFLFRAHYRKHLTADLDARRGDGIASKPPLQISLRITNACNHRCAVCGQYGDRGYVRSENGKHLLHTIPKERYLALVDEVKGWKPLFYLTGGEPFLYPGLMEVTARIREAGCPLSIVTNGVGLEKHAEDIVRQRWDMVLVSLDGPEEVHDRCRGLKGAFQSTIQGIRALREARDRVGKIRPYIFTSTTISRVNAPFLEETFEIGNSLGLDAMIIYLSWFTTEEIGRAHTEILERELGITPFSWQGYLNSYTEIDQELLVEAIRRVQSRRWNFETLIIPNLPLERIRDYYLNPKEMFGYSRCIAPYFMVDVMPNGDVVTCRDYIDVKAGNILENPLLDIWNGEGFRRFRKLLHKQGGLLPICCRCCGLMGF